MLKKITDLFEFIDRAVKSRKYPESTAQGLRAALKAFDSVLNEEERQSLELFKKNIDPIYQSVFNKYGKEFSSGTLAVYKSRVLKVVNDYEKYGTDPAKMANWMPKIIKRGPRKKSLESNEEIADNEIEPSTVSPDSGKLNKIELMLRDDETRSIIMVPRDLKSSECKRIKMLLDSLVIDPE